MNLRDAFLAHGIAHVSASTLNAYAAEPAMWVLERLLRRRAPQSAAMCRGKAIEAGVSEGLVKPWETVAACQDVAVAVFHKEIGMNPDPKKQQELDAVKPSVAMALSELRRYGVPDIMQGKVEHDLGPELPPLIGYLDYGWSASGMLVDLKTQLRLASDNTVPHARQVAAYVYGTNYEGRICYVTPKKVAVYLVEDVPRRFGELREIAVRLGRFLALSEDPHELASLLVPNVDHFMWSNPLSQAYRQEVYGL